MNLLFCAGAVPFGYTSEMNDSDFQCHASEPCVRAMNWRNSHWNQAPSPPLPDVIVSHTSPPSPLRRAHSHQFLFPEEPPSSEAPRPPPQRAGVVGVGGGGGGIRGENEPDVRAGLGHIQEVRRALLQEDERPGMKHLPKLSWEVPRPSPRVGEGVSSSSSPSSPVSGGDGPQPQEVLGEQETKWKNIGKDLRKLADQFTLDHAKVGSKRDDEGGLSLTVPEAVTKCLTATILCLVWWRVLNKFR